MDAEHEVLVNDKGGAIDTNTLTPQLKGFFLRQPPNINYNDEITTWHSMGRSKLIVNARALHNISKSYINVVNAIATFFNLLN